MDLESLNRFKKNKVALASSFILIIEILLIVVLPIVLKLDPYTVDKANFSANPGINGHLLGTDSIGRDVFSRLVYGGRVSFSVGIFSCLISMVIGVPLGLLAGWFSKTIGEVIMRLTDIFMSFPSVILVLVMVSLIGPSATSVSLVIGLMGWTTFARIMYSSVLKVKNLDFITGARAVGLSKGKIIFKYIVPNSIAPVLTNTTASIASAILTESALSFLGMGVQPPVSSWGNNIYEAQSIAVLAFKPWQWAPAGICIFITILCINFFGDGLREALNPKN